VRHRQRLERVELREQVARRATARAFDAPVGVEPSELRLAKQRPHYGVPLDAALWTVRIR